jgi:Ca-activated chloride channel homolog
MTHAELPTPYSSEPGLQDLLGAGKSGSSVAESSANREDRQAMEQMLRRVEDDPAGLLRQRFLLQHLRRSGQLP